MKWQKKFNKIEKKLRKEVNGPLPQTEEKELANVDHPKDDSMILQKNVTPEINDFRRTQRSFEAEYPQKEVERATMKSPLPARVLQPLNQNNVVDKSRIPQARHQEPQTNISPKISEKEKPMTKPEFNNNNLIREFESLTKANATLSNNLKDAHDQIEKMKLTINSQKEESEKTRLLLQASTTKEQETEKKYRESTEQNNAQLKIIEGLRFEVKEFNEKYLKKITEKAMEAQKLLDARTSELSAKFALDIKEQKKYAISDDAVKLIETISMFENALKYADNIPKELQNYFVGFKMIHASFQELLHSMKITQIVVNQGEKFDFNIMTSFEEVENSNFPSETVAEVVSNGYRLHDKVIKYCVVKVQK